MMSTEPVWRDDLLRWVKPVAACIMCDLVADGMTVGSMAIGATRVNVMICPPCVVRLEEVDNAKQ